MPAVNEKQATLFRIAEAMKKGKVKKSYSPEAAGIAKTLTGSKIKEFTKVKS